MPHPDAADDFRPPLLPRALVAYRAMLHLPWRHAHQTQEIHVILPYICLQLYDTIDRIYCYLMPRVLCLFQAMIMQSL